MQFEKNHLTVYLFVLKISQFVLIILIDYDVRPDILRYTDILKCTQKPTSSQLSLLHDIVN